MNPPPNIVVGAAMRLNDKARIATGLSVEVTSVDPDENTVTVRVTDGRSAYKGTLLTVRPSHLSEMSGNRRMTLLRQQVRRLTVERDNALRCVAELEREITRLREAGP